MAMDRVPRDVLAPDDLVALVECYEWDVCSCHLVMPACDQGVWLWDVDGNAHIDCVGDDAVASVRPSGPAAVDAVTEQAGSLVTGPSEEDVDLVVRSAGAAPHES